MYKVICTFADLLDNKHIYRAGDEYPRRGYSPSSDRIEELSTNRNRTRRPLIEFIPDTVVEAVVEEPESVVETVVEAVVEEPKKTTRGRKKAKDGNTD